MSRPKQRVAVLLPHCKKETRSSSILRLAAWTWSLRVQKSLPDCRIGRNQLHAIAAGSSRSMLLWFHQPQRELLRDLNCEDFYWPIQHTMVSPVRKSDWGPARNSKICAMSSGCATCC